MTQKLTVSLNCCEITLHLGSNKNDIVQIIYGLKFKSNDED